MRRPHPETVTHGLALALTLAVAAGVLAQKTNPLTQVSVVNPGIQVVLEPEPAPPAPEPPPPVPQPTPKPRTVDRLEPHRQAPSPPLMADIAPIQTTSEAIESDSSADSAAPPPLRPAPASSGSIEAAYGATLRTNIDARTTVPTSTDYRLLKPRGETRVSFTLDRGGAVLDTVLSKSSGSGILDRQAIRIVQTGRYPPFPEDAFRGESRHSFIVTLEFNT